MSHTNGNSRSSETSVDVGMRVPQIAPINRNATVRKSSDSVWPLRNKDGLTWAQVKEMEKLA